MALAQGHKSYVQIGTQTDYDTPAAATQKLELVSEGIQHMTEVIPDPSLYDGRSHRDLIDGPAHAAGPMRFRAGYEGLEQTLRAGMGGYSSSTPGAGVIGHALTEGDQKILTAEISRGNLPSAKIFQFQGGKIRSFTWECPANGAAMLDIDFIGKDLVPDLDPTAALSFPALFPVVGKQGVSMIDGTADVAADIRVRNTKITHTIPLTEDRFFVGGANMDEPLPSDFRTTVWEITQEFKTLTAYNAARDRTVGSLDFLYRHPTIITGSLRRQIRFRSTSAKCSYSAPVEGYGVLIATATWTAYHNATDGGSLKIDIQNTVAALP